MRKFFLSFSGLCIALFLFSSVSAQIVSSGFESWTAGKPDGWWGVKTNIAASAVTQYTTNIHGGASAVRLVNQTTTHKRFTTQPVPVVTGTVYTVSFWVRGHGNIRVGLFDNRTTGTSAGYATYSAYTNVNSNAWTQITYNDTAAATYASAEFILSIQSTLADLEDIQVDDYSVIGGSSNPGITIVSPLANATVYDDFVNVKFVTTNFQIPTTGHVQYNIDGGVTQQHLLTTPIPVTGLSAGSHTVALMLVDVNNNPITPVAATSVTFTVDLTGGTLASTVAELRALPADNTTIYRFTGQAVVTQLESSVFQKFVQDGTAGILIYDPSNLLTVGSNVGDAITNIVGRLQLYNNMLEFIPVNAGSLVSSGNIVVPTTITLNDLNANFETYEAQLVKIEGVTFGATGSFVAGKAYKITNSVDSFRCSFYLADYIGTAIPTGTINLTGILNARAAGNYITARKLVDFAVPSAGYTISGVVNYNNTALTAIASATLNLMNGTSLIATTTTDAFGNYTFSNIADGTYTVTMTTATAWGGLSATDVLKMKRHVAGLELFLEPIRLTAADVNVTSSITATDVLKVARRIAGLDASFTRADWIMEIPGSGGSAITVNSANLTQNFFAICTGDVNGSYVPVLK